MRLLLPGPRGGGGRWPINQLCAQSAPSAQSLTPRFCLPSAAPPDMFDGSALAGGNFTIGPPVVAALRRRFPNAFLDCHLAVEVGGWDRRLRP